MVNPAITPDSPPMPRADSPQGLRGSVISNFEPPGGVEAPEASENALRMAASLRSALRRRRAERRLQEIENTPVDDLDITKIPSRFLEQAVATGQGAIRGTLHFFDSLWSDPWETISNTPDFLWDVGKATAEEFGRMIKQPHIELINRPFSSILNLSLGMGIGAQVTRRLGATAASKSIARAANAIDPFVQGTRLLRAGASRVPFIQKMGEQVSQKMARQSEKLALLRMRDKALKASEKIQKLIPDEASQRAAVTIMETAANSTKMIDDMTSLQQLYPLNTIEDDVFRMFESAGMKVEGLQQAKEALKGLRKGLEESGGERLIRKVDEGVDPGPTGESFIGDAKRALEGARTRTPAEGFRKIDEDFLKRMEEGVEKLQKASAIEKWWMQYRGIEIPITDDIMDAVRLFEQEVEPFRKMATAAGKLSPDIEVATKQVALAQALDVPVGTIKKLDLDWDEFRYFPHIPLESKLDVTTIDDFARAKGQSKTLTPKLGSFDRLKKRVGQLEEFNQNPAEVLAKLVEEQSRFVERIGFIEQTISRWLANNQAVRVSEKAVGALEDGTKTYKHPVTGELIDPEKWKFMDPDNIMELSARDLHLRVSIAEEMASGKSLSEVIDEMIEHSSPEDAQVLLRTRKLKKTGRIAVRNDAADVFMKNMGIGNNPAPWGITMVYDNLTNMWRGAVLGLSPRWVIFNAVGNMVLNFFGGVKLADYKDALRGSPIRKMLGDFPEEVSKTGQFRFEAGITKGEIGDIAKTLSGRQPLLKLSPDVEATKLGKSVRKITDAPPLRWIGNVRDRIVNFNAKVEAFAREARAVRAMKGIAKKQVERAKEMGGKLITYEEALKSVVRQIKPRGSFLKAPPMLERVAAQIDDTLFNYAKMSDFEQNIIRRAFPFWSWHRNITAATLSLPSKSRVKVPLMAALVRHGAPEFDTSLPDWLRGSAPIGMDDEGNTIFLSMRGLNPYVDALEVLKRGGDAILPNTNPLVKVAIEQLTGQDTFRRRPFTDSTVIRGFDGRSYRYNPDTGEAEQVTVRPNLLMHIGRQIPQFKIAESFIHPGLRADTSTLLDPQFIRDRSGRKLFPEGRGARQLQGLLLGARTTSFDVERLKNKQIRLNEQARRQLELFQAKRRRAELRRRLTEAQ